VIACARWSLGAHRREPSSARAIWSTRTRPSCRAATVSPAARLSLCAPGVATIPGRGGKHARALPDTGHGRGGPGDQARERCPLSDQSACGSGAHRKLLIDPISSVLAAA
jgi:hypothetical protein